MIGVRPTGWSAAALPPGPSSSSLLQTLRWVARPVPFMDECARRYGDCFTIRLKESPPMVFVSDPEAIRQVFTADPDVLRAGEANAILGPVLGRHSVLLLDGPRHLRQRRLMLPSFHGDVLASYRESIAAIVEREVATWPLGTPLRLWPRMQAITLEVIVRTVFGVEDRAAAEQLRDVLRGMLEWVTGPSRLLMLAMLGPERIERWPMTGFGRALAPVDRLLRAIIRERRADPRTAERDDVLSLLLRARDEDGGSLTDDECRDELVTLLVAGHETTATSLSWAIERILRHPTVLDRLRQEIADGREEYLDAVIKETLRLRPVISIVARRVKAPYELMGHTLPAGVEIAPCIHLVHRRADVYPDPLAFRPERFLERPAGTYTWIPFGGGTRRCLGASFAQLEMKVALQTILAMAELEPDRAEPERIARRAITMTPARGAAVVLRHRRARPTPTQSAPAGSASGESATPGSALTGSATPASAPTGSAPAESSSRRRLRTLT